jgi:hypothetical protein
MKMINLMLLLAAASAFIIASTTLAVTTEEIERMLFDQAYGLWLQEQAALVPPAVVTYSYKDPKTGQIALSNFPHVEHPSGVAIAIGSTNAKTGKFTPTTFWALTCRLGQQAHNHEAFLRCALATNEWVSAILDASASLCTKYRVESEAVVRFDPNGGYTELMRDYRAGPDTRKEVWLKAAAKVVSQRGAANGSQPIHVGTNKRSGAAGSHR